MKVGWITYGNRNVGGARIQCYNMHNFLLEKGVDSEILYAEKWYSNEFHFTKEQIDNFLKKNCDIIVVHKFNSGDSFWYLVEQARRKGVKLIYIGLDEMNVDFASACDGVIVISKYLKSIMPNEHRKKTYVVFDSYEHDGKKFKKHTNLKKIKLVYLGGNVGMSRIHQIDYLPKNVSAEVISLPLKKMKELYDAGMAKFPKPFPKTPFKYKYFDWDLKTSFEIILKADVAVIPYKQNHWKLEHTKKKSANRLILFMSLGLPTIVSPTAEYKPLIKQGKNGFIAKKPEEWIKYIEYLRDNPRVRASIGAQARKDVVPKYSKESQGELYLKIFKKVLKLT